MLKRVAAILASIFVALGMGLTISSSAAAAPDPPVGCSEPNEWTGECSIGITLPGGPGKPGTQPISSPTKQKCFSNLAKKEVPCSSPDGTWSNSYDCYLKVQSPQPPKSDPIWAGHTTGAIYGCTGPAGAGIGVFANVWLAQGPAIVVDPEALARQALAAMNLRGIAVGITPEPRPDRMGSVGLPTYLWVANPTGPTFGPITRSVSEGGITVTATATVKRIVWSMGDGSQVNCNGRTRAQGTPYQDSFGKRPSPTCGYSYPRPGEFTVAATSYWTVDWAGGGENGSIPLDLSVDTQIRIGESQALNQ